MLLPCWDPILLLLRSQTASSCFVSTKKNCVFLHRVFLICFIKKIWSELCLKPGHDVLLLSSAGEMGFLWWWWWGRKQLAPMLFKVFITVLVDSSRSLFMSQCFGANWSFQEFGRLGLWQADRHTQRHIESTLAACCKLEQASTWSSNITLTSSKLLELGSCTRDKQKTGPGKLPDWRRDLAATEAVGTRWGKQLGSDPTSSCAAAGHRYCLGWCSSSYSFKLCQEVPQLWVLGSSCRLQGKTAPWDLAVELTSPAAGSLSWLSLPASVCSSCFSSHGIRHRRPLSLAILLLLLLAAPRCGGPYPYER